ncbi:unnamed protein product [Cuscuta campestris]|uniref:Myb-like domain-containing protein n=2 Tax=Cuscuta sect. Cleistogrammica TaxID=1824901 RepID=A0A484JZD0_9ASTE|nr:hypothetical protein DM860_008540 [Cuscuta australis]VFQ58470.1 unnamed protein product [Cuscuta campestris]
MLDYPPRKHVPIGPDHQAEIPCWGPLENKNVPDVGISILHSSETDEEVGYGRTVCNCPDKGSIRCVRQHVSEARDRLRRTFGQATFAELGFNDMGEVVAEKWSAEEEELFDDIIYSNPASTGKDFWKALSAVFPSRTKMEIVSYYFNVNMLRKRAEQNRLDPLNIDSDNDEWQGSDNEESTIQDGLDDNGPQKQEYETDSEPAFELHVKKSDEGENGTQDGGSSTSSDSGVQGGSCLSKSDGCLEWNRYNTLDSYDTKLLWENTSSSSPEIDLDFLPTCSMIEEIFGEGSFDSKGW